MELISIGAAMLLAGSVAGVLAGLLGVGGGIVLVPMLETTLAVFGVDASVRMHMAVATSLATIIPTSISSARAHHRRGAIDFGMIREWAPLILLGAVGGIVISSHISGRGLAAVFAVVALLAAIRMLVGVDVNKQHENGARSSVMSGVAIRRIVPVGIGGVSTLMGIGGGLISVPTMTMIGKPVHVAVGTSALFGLAIALPATIGYVLTGWDHPQLPDASLGYVSVLGFLFIAPATILCAPLGARLAHAVSQRRLSLLFGVFLLAGALRIGSQAFA